MIKAGPLTRSTTDAAIIYAALSDDLPGHFYSLLYDGETGPGLPKPTLAGYGDTQDLSDVRIGYYKDWFQDSDPAVNEV